MNIYIILLSKCMIGNNIKYLQLIKDELELNYDFNFSALSEIDIQSALYLLALNLEKKDQLYNEDYTELAKINFLKTLKKVETRAIQFLRNTLNTSDNFNFLKNSFIDIVNNTDITATIPHDLIYNNWPVILAPNIFLTAPSNTLPYPYYLENIKDINLTKWGKDPYILIEFSLFVKCPVNCSYCPHDSLNQASKNKFIDLEKFKNYLDKIPKEVGIVFAGFCEPLLYKDFDKAVLYAHSQGYRLFVATTLPEKFTNNLNVFFNEELWEGRSIHIRDEYMKYIKNSEEYYKNVDRFLRQMHFNKNEKRDMRFSFLGDRIDNKILLLLKKYNLMHLLSRVHPFQRIESPIEYSEPEKSNFLTGKIYCSKGFYRKQMVVPGGDVVICCMDVEKKHVLGNLETHSYKEIYSNNEYKKILRGFNDEKENTICRKCVYAKKVPANICLSYSADSNYLKFLATSIASLNNTSPDIYAHIDIINTENCRLFDKFKNVLIKNTVVDELKNKNYSIVKNISSEIIQERSVKLTGAYANLMKVYNIYSLLVNYNFDYIINMDADNIITKDLTLFFNSIDTTADLLLKYSSKEKLVGEKLKKRYFNFKDFDLNKIDLNNLDVHFREGCLVVRNTETSRKFFKYISENILNKIAWYGDSYWITRAYLNFKNLLKIAELPNNFVNYDINDTSVEPYVVSGYGSNKHSSRYAAITRKYD